MGDRRGHAQRGETAAPGLGIGLHHRRSVRPLPAGGGFFRGVHRIKEGPRTTGGDTKTEVHLMGEVLSAIAFVISVFAVISSIKAERKLDNFIDQIQQHDGKPQ